MEIAVEWEGADGYSTKVMLVLPCHRVGWHGKQLPNQRLCCPVPLHQVAVGGQHSLWNKLVIHVTTTQGQVRIMCVFATVSFVRLLAEYKGLHGPRGWKIHRLKGTQP